MMARMFKPPKAAPRPAENKAVRAKERKTAATPPAASQGIQSGEGIFSQCYGQHDTSK